MGYITGAKNSSMGFHTTDPVEDTVLESNSIVPGGCIKILQPADVSWNAPFKSTYRLHYDSWLARDDRSVTPAGNPRAPPKVLMVQWVVASGKSISAEVIRILFAACGITTSNPDAIHCLRDSGVASDAYTAIHQLHHTDVSTVRVTEEEDQHDVDSDSASDDFSACIARNFGHRPITLARNGI